MQSTRLHLILYSFLLVATPFVLLQNFLQQAIGELSAAKIPVGGVEIPIIPIVAGLVLVVVLAVLRREITRWRILAFLLAVGMIALAQQITDYYFQHAFYELQQNWHYLAYAIFAFLVYRDLRPRGVSFPRIAQVTWLLALVFSTFDEAFQMNMSNRIFDVSDIAKDLWGACTGIVLLAFGRREKPDLQREGRRIRQPRIGLYFRRTGSTLVLLLGSAFVLLNVSSLLTARPYWAQVFLLWIALTILGFALLHATGRRPIAVAVTILLVLAAAAGVVRFATSDEDPLRRPGYGLSVYRGIPIPLFDFLVFPDGSFRLVDKKHHFNQRDQVFLLKQKTDIVLIGSGSRGLGGHGFPEGGKSQFLYNPYTGDGTQVIVLPTEEACALFNRLKREGKHLLLVLHNTC